jgi:hypothetical protein
MWILTVYSQYIYSVLLFIVNNRQLLTEAALGVRGA